MKFTWRILSSLLLCASLAFGVTACGDDDGDTPGDGDGDGDGGPITVDAGDGDGDGDGDVDAGGDGDGDVDAEVPAGSCANKADIAALMATYGTGGDGGSGQSVSTIAGSCGVQAISDPSVNFNADDPDFPVLTTTCLDTATMSAITDACESCIVTQVICAAQNCISECLDGGDDCTACRCGKNADSVNCVADYSACSGLPDDTCEAGDGT